MNPICLRWGRSAYETDQDLQREAQALQSLPLQWQYDDSPTPSWDGVSMLVVHSKQRVTTEVLARAPALQLVLTTTSGYDHIDVQAARARGIRVARCPLARRDAVIETSLAMGYSFLRALPTLQQRAQSGKWARAELPHLNMRLLRGLRVGIVGYGVIGQRAAQVWQSLGAQVQVSDPVYPDAIPLEALAASSDILTLHCALNSQTHRIIQSSLLAQMPAGAILLNTARGPCVDVDAVLQAKHLGGIGLDVFPEEPYPQLSDLSTHPNVLLTPHAAGFHHQLGQSIVEEVYETMRSWLEDQTIPHEVTAREDASPTANP